MSWGEMKDKKDGHGMLLFYATPLTDLCRSFHAPQQLSVDSPGKFVNFNLINIICNRREDGARITLGKQS